MIVAPTMVNFGEAPSLIEGIYLDCVIEVSS
jgi:hypothetical protein